jgi:hypothetical protein
LDSGCAHSEGEIVNFVDHLARDTRYRLNLACTNRVESGNQLRKHLGLCYWNTVRSQDHCDLRRERCQATNRGCIGTEIGLGTEEPMVAG